MMTSATSGSTLLRLLEAQGFAEHRSDLAVVWPAVKTWIATPLEDVDTSRDWRGFEAAFDDDEDDTAEAVFSIATFRVVTDATGGQLEQGVELRYAPSAEWAAITDRDDWDSDHPIGFHFWAYDDQERSAEFINAIEATPMFRLAAARSPLLVRVFGCHDENLDLIVGNATPI